MKKLIIFLMLAVFCLSLTPLFAMNYDPYKDDGISDKPATREHPWDDPKYDKDSVYLKNNTSKVDNESSSKSFIHRLISNIFGIFYPQKEEDKRNEEKRPNIKNNYR